MSVFTDADDRAFLATLTVLLAEDEPAARDLTDQFLARRVGRVLVACDGEEALALFHAQAPDLVVSDIAMPRMDGLLLAEALCEEAPALPVILLTAFERTDYLRRAIAAGVDRYVLKPVEASQLEEALLHCARRLRAERELARRGHREMEMMRARYAHAIGVLAGGLAHDYNNLLQNVLGYWSLVEVALRNGEDPKPYFDEVSRCYGDVERLGSRLKLLYGENIVSYTTAPIVSLLEGTVRAGFDGSSVRVRLELPRGLPPVPHNAERLGSVFTSIVRNARDAMSEGGAFSVSVCSEALDDLNPQCLPPGHYLHLRFHDTGRGIAPDLLPRVFDPYFTTKRRDAIKGKGLSLAIARAIVALHQGAIEAESQPGDTTVHLFLPLVRAEVSRGEG